jgi:hypothetical protein
MANAEALRGAGSDAYGPVDPGRDDPGDPLGTGKAIDPRPVLRGDDGAPIGIPEARRGGIAVGRDDIEASRPGGGKQAELSRSGS